MRAGCWGRPGPPTREGGGVEWRGTQRYITTQCDDEDALTKAILELASQYGRYGYRRITALLQRAGWNACRDRVQRISTPPRAKAARVGDPGSGGGKD